METYVEGFLWDLLEDLHCLRCIHKIFMEMETKNIKSFPGDSSSYYNTMRGRLSDPYIKDENQRLLVGA